MTAKSTRKKQSRVGAVIAGAFLAAMTAAPAAAQSGAPLEQALKAAASTAASEAPSADEPQTAAPADNPVLKFFASTELTGFVDTYYSYNFNTPKTPCSLSAGVSIFNCLHAFDVAHNAFSLNLAELALEKKPTTDSRAGYRIDLDYGAGAGLVAGFEPGGSTPIYKNIQQAYVSYLAPAGKGGLRFDFGKFVTPAGFEVIESKDNWNYSRGLLFTLAIPLYHQGLRVAYSPNDKATLTGFLFNGWNNSVENNGGKSVGFQFIGKPTSAFAVTANYIGGPEIPGNNSDWRHLFDVVATYTVSPMVSVAANYDIGKELSTKWQGIAAYLKYQPNAWFALTPRYEFFNDKDGWALIGQNVQEFTLTGEFKHNDGVVMRVEYRGDFTQDPFFVKNTSEVVKTQNAITVAWVYAFSSKMP
jgi:hypothetical protein